MKVTDKSNPPPRAGGCLPVLFVTPPSALTDRSNRQCHSSMILEITKEIGSRKKMGSCKARIYVQNFDAVLVVMLILAGEAIFANFDWRCRKHINIHNSY